MQNDSLKKLYVDELKDLYSAEMMEHPDWATNGGNLQSTAARKMTDMRQSSSI